jgi:K+-transporting ATPase ATPase B chain
LSALVHLMTTVVVFADILSGHFSSFNFQITIGFGLPYCLPTLPKQLLKAGVKHRQIVYVKAVPRQKPVSWFIIKKKLFLANDLRKGDIVVCDAGDIIPADGDVIEGIASVDESAITGESAPVIRESGGDRCAVTGGTKVISDRIQLK